MQGLPLKPTTVSEFAEFFSIAPITVYRLIGSGSLPHHRIGKKIIFTTEDVEQFLASCAVGAGQEGGQK
ncbi:MAG TPA: helix-turn-helix domain-containing protein [Spirochaetales bacterium]|nr:helix-turn-helix domain-containing protein [Spirochaetales bacterium]